MSVCYYDSDNSWWVSKAVKKRHSSSVTSVAWHPNSALLATTSTDRTCRIFCVPIRSVDGSGEADKEGAEGESHEGFSIGKFGEQLLQLDLSFGWTFGAVWSPSGANLAFLGEGGGGKREEEERGRGGKREGEERGRGVEVWSVWWTC